MNTAEIMKTYGFYAQMDLSKYAGGWIALVGKKVIAHAKNVQGLMEQVNRLHPAATPFVAKVPSNNILLW